MAEKVENWFEKGLKEGKNRQYKSALFSFSQWSMEGHPEAWLWIGRCYHGLKLYSKALFSLETYLLKFPEDPEGYFHLGRSFLSLGNYPRGIKSLEQAKKLGSRHRFLSVLLGYAYLKSRRPEPAQEYLRLAVEQHPQNKSIYQGYLNSLLVYGISCFRGENFEMSRDVMVFLLSNNYQNPLIKLYLAGSFRALNKWSSATEVYTELSGENPEDPSLLVHLMECSLHLKDSGLRNQISENLKVSFPNFSIPSFSEIPTMLAWNAFQEKQYHAAIHYALVELKKTGNPHMHFLIGESYRNLGQSQKAANHLRRAKEKISAPEIFYSLIQVLWESQQWVECRQEVLRFQRLHPQDSFGEYFKALIESQTSENTEQNISLLQNQVHVRGPDPRLMKALGKEYLKAKRQDLAWPWLWRTIKLLPQDDEAIELLLPIFPLEEELDHWEKIIEERKEKQVQLALWLSGRYAHKNNWKKALVHLNYYLSLVPGSRRGWELMAHIEKAVRHYQEALEIYSSLLQRDNRNTFYLVQVLFCLLKIKAHDRASRFQTRVFSLIADPLLRYSFGKAHQKSGDHTQALQLFRYVLKFFPGHPQTLRAISESEKIISAKNTKK